MEKLDLAFNILENRRELLAHIDKLATEDFDEGKKFCLGLLKIYDGLPEKSRAVSGAFAACLSSFLLHKKNKVKLIELLEEEAINSAFFGELNSYKYSIVFVLKRVLKENKPELTARLLTLLLNNPFRNEAAKPYSDEWGLALVIDETIKAPEDYLNLSKENYKLVREFRERVR